MTREEQKQIADYVRSWIHEIITESGTDKNAHTNEILRKVADGIEALSIEPKKMGHWVANENPHAV